MTRVKKWIIRIIIIAVLVGIPVWYVKSKQSKTEYTTADVTRGNLAQTVSLTGKMNPNEQIDLTFKTTGKLKSINVDVGDTVQKGQVLATIDAGTLISQLGQAQAQLKYQKETFNYMEKHKSTYKRDQRDAQEALVKQAQSAIDAINDQLADINMVSPINGVVTKRTADPGETVVLSLNSPVLSIAAKDDLIIHSNVPESDIVKITLGQRAKVTFDALSPEEIFDATVTSIDPASTVIQDVVYYRIKLQLDNLDPRLKAGMSANIDIKTIEKENVLMIPIRAVKGENGEKYVDILNESDNTTQKAKVVTGIDGDDGMLEIISGLKAGDKVVTFVSEK